MSIDHSKPENHLPEFIAKMRREGLKPLVIDTFAYYYQMVLTGETGMISDRDIHPVNPDEIEAVEDLSDFGGAGKNAFKNAVRIVLNGGLGTSMGLTGPKSVLEFKNGESFLSVILKQAQNSNVKLALMNSFSTHADTLNALAELRPSACPLTFLQHKFPKILQDNYSPAVWPKNPALEWNPPGHGDVYTALYASGALQGFLDEGIQYAFISNSDNLGARMDASLLGYFAEHQFPFMMEVAEKTPQDLKGGHLARHNNGRLILREAVQCPEDELKAFQDIRHYRYFNTNSIWVNLRSLKKKFDKDQKMQLPMILNPKTLDPRDEGSPAVFQIETAMGAAVELFEGATAVKVPRSRFFPVKTCNDLLVLRSDCMIFGEKDNLKFNPERLARKKTEVVKINLDPKFYKKVDDLDQRFCNGIPSLVDCDALTIEGDVLFESNVTIKGSVRIRNTQKSQAVIKSGTIIDHDLNF